MNVSAVSESDSKARPRPFTFYPPNNKRWVIKLAHWGIRRSIESKLKVTEIELDDLDQERLRRLKGQRCLLTPSHSGGFEPHILMYLSKLLDDNYNYVATMELFQQSWFYRWLMPRLGAYSIIRGSFDRASFTMTRKLMTEGKRWLVIFPEGHTIWQNNTVIRFQEGVAQLAFKSYLDASKQDADAHLFCVPIAIKYVYLKEMHTEIDESLDRLDAKLSLDPSVQLTRHGRLRRIADVMLTANERTHGMNAPPGGSLNERVDAIKERIVNQLEQQLGVQPSKNETLLGRVRSLFNSVDQIVYQEPKGSEYECDLMRERQTMCRTLYEELWRVQDFAAIYDGYVSESMTFERFLDVLSLLEMEVFKERRVWGPRRAKVKVGEPIDLKNYIDDYHQDRRATVKEVTLTLENSVREMLGRLSEECHFVDDVVVPVRTGN